MCKVKDVRKVGFFLRNCTLFSGEELRELHWDGRMVATFWKHRDSHSAHAKKGVVIYS